MDSTDSDDLDVKTLLSLLAERLRERVISHPLSTLGGAAAVGYMLGWSMPTPLYRSLAGMAIRSVIMQALGNIVAKLQDDFGLLGDGDDFDDLDLSEGSSGASGPSSGVGQSRAGEPSPYVA